MRVMTSNTWFQNSKLHPFSLDLFDFHPCHALLHPESLDLLVEALTFSAFLVSCSNRSHALVIGHL